MVVIPAIESIAKRDLCRNRHGDLFDCDGAWYSWGRYALAGAAIFLILAIALSCTCIARRRRRRGTMPVYGTGWMAPQGGKFGVQNQNGYNMGGYNAGGHGQQTSGHGPEYANPPPAYGQQAPQYTGSTFNPSDGYYGQQQQGHVQPPTNTYQPDNVYSPPVGPPPGK